MEESDCESICGAPTTLADKGEMMMMMVVDHIIYRDYTANRRTFTYCSLACSEVVLILPGCSPVPKDWTF